MLLGPRRTDQLGALAPKLTHAGGTAAFQGTDVTDAADVRDFVTAARERSGRIDVASATCGSSPSPHRRAQPPPTPWAGTYDWEFRRDPGGRLLTRQQLTVRWTDGEDAPHAFAEAPAKPVQG
ncbi:hypothetical protein [Streptomyces ficellus]|uniref:hypothetical protein n=1 Tax=Streptomyces ficellus TaxID=1977088 RepID=UPI003CC734F8